VGIDTLTEEQARYLASWQKARRPARIHPQPATGIFPWLAGVLLAKVPAPWHSRKEQVMTPPAIPAPEEIVIQSLFGFMITKGVSAVASHGVPDALKDGPLYYVDLAAQTGTDQRALHRVMRMLSSIGMFAEPEPGKYANTPASELLRADVPGSMRDVAIMVASDSHWLPWGRLEDTLKSGNSGSQHAFGTDIFTWLQIEDNREQWEIFNAAMSSFSIDVGHAAAEAYDFKQFRHIIDIGGGHGLFLKALLESSPDAQGTLFDLPQVVEGAEANLLNGRIERAGGSFFDGVPAGGDCYTLKHIIHDWGDEHCRTILGHIANAMQPDGKVLIIETIMPEAHGPHPAKFMDVNMLAMTEGGCERTEREFKALLESARLRLVAIHPATEEFSVIEAVRA
jgi:hypothetical protein